MPGALGPLEEFRKVLNEEYQKQDIKISPLAFLLKAAVFALKKFPELNASLDGEKLVYKKYYLNLYPIDNPANGTASNFELMLPNNGQSPARNVNPLTGG